MSRLTIQERFELPAPPDRVFQTLVDPERVVTCLPGASLEGRDEEAEGRVYRGRITVKVGAVSIGYRGTAEFEEVDEAQRRVRVRATGREKSGSGSARMTMESRVEEGEDGGSVVTVDAEVEVAGKIVRFGRGMIERISAEIFKDFTACLEGRVTGGGPGGVTGETGGTGKSGESGAGAAEGADRAAEGGGGDENGRDGADTGAEMKAFPLLFRALKGAVRDVVRRLFGRE